MTVGHAKKGGEVARVNGAFYKGGQFLPTTTAPPGTWRIKFKGKSSNLASGKELIEPGKWEHSPSPFARSVYQAMGGGTYVDVNRDTGHASLNPHINWDYVGDPNEKRPVLYKHLAQSKEHFSTNDLVGLYNRGVRWIDTEPNPGVEIVAKSDA